MTCRDDGSSMAQHRITVGEELRYDADVRSLRGLNATYVQGSQLPVNAKSPPYNAKGDNSTDDTTALQAAFTAAAGAVCFVPDGTYLVTSTLTLPATASLVMSENAIIKANASIAGPVVQTPLATFAVQQVIRGGVIDANNLAQNALWVRYARHYEIRSTVVRNATQHTLILGDTNAAASSYETMLNGVICDRTSGSVGAYYALWAQNSSDSRAFGCVFKGQQTGVRCDGSDWQFFGCHAWTNGMVTCFDDNGSGNEYSGCVVDTPTTYGFRLRGSNTRIIGGKTYVNSLYGVDNTVIAIHADAGGATTPAFFTVLGHHFQGADGTHRLAKDSSVTDATNPVYAFNQYTNVASTLNPQNHIGQTSFSGQPTFNNQPNIFAQAQVYAAAGSTRFVQFSSGGSVGSASSRWQVGANGTGEAGSNAGSDFDINSKTDAGAALHNPVHIIRANGVVQTGQGIGLRVKAGTVSDADFATAPPDGTCVADSTGSKLWVRLGGTWKSTTLA